MEPHEKMIYFVAALMAFLFCIMDLTHS